MQNNLTQSNQPTSFQGLGIAPKLLAVLTHNKFIQPTPIQHQAIPAGIDGKDVVGIAQTGTGKTLAFGIPMLQRLGRIHKGKMGLVVLPTRELAQQVDETLQQIGRSLGIRTTVLIGGEPQQRQIRSLRAHPHVIIATPGRLVDHLQQRTVKLDQVAIFVLDEADRMFDMGFAPQLNKIIAHLPKPDQRQTMLFSATMPHAIMQIATKHMQLPVRIEVAPAGTSSEQVEQEMIIVKKEKKREVLEKLLNEYRGTVLVFSRTKHGAKKITRDIHALGHHVAEIHSNRSLAQRREALAGFKSGKYRVLVATDIAARGIDVHNIELVINFDLPDNSEDYVHRIGRTGRAGNTGRAISLATPDQKRDIRDIERLIRKTLQVTNTLSTAEQAAPQAFAPSRGNRSRPPRSRRPFRTSSSRGRGRR